MVIDFNKTFKDYEVVPIRETEVYTVSDINYLSNLVVSETILHPEQCTSGHSHDDLDEVYVFVSGHGCIEYAGDQYRSVENGSTVLIKGGEFHKVFNTGKEDLKFISIFQKYERS